MRMSKMPLLACLFVSMTSLALAADEKDEAVARERAIRKYLEVKFDNFVETPEGRKVFGPAYNSKHGLKPFVVKELQEFLPDTFYYATSLDTIFGAEGGTPTIIVVTKRGGTYDIRTCLWPVMEKGALPEGKFLNRFAVAGVTTEAQRKQFTMGMGRLLAEMSSHCEVKNFAAEENSASVQVWGVGAMWLQITVKFDDQGRTNVTIERMVENDGIPFPDVPPYQGISDKEWERIRQDITDAESPQL